MAIMRPRIIGVMISCQVFGFRYPKGKIWTLEELLTSVVGRIRS